VSEEANDSFINVVEDYFDQDEEALKEDERPEVHYQGASFSLRFLHLLSTFPSRSVQFLCFFLDVADFCVGLCSRSDVGEDGEGPLPSFSLSPPFSWLTFSSFPLSRSLFFRTQPKCHSFDPCKAIIASLDPSERPLDLAGGNADPKCRFVHFPLPHSFSSYHFLLASFFHRMGKTPPVTDFPSLRMENVTPRAFSSTWANSMETWGTQIKSAVEGVSEMLAVGLGLPRETLVQAGEYGSHLLAPTSTDLKKYGKEGESAFSLPLLASFPFPSSFTRPVNG
jgi:hypothetical protein